MKIENEWSSRDSNPRRLWVGNLDDHAALNQLRYDLTHQWFN
jgi:hypothetical protein